jgi:death-on-curing protein
MESLFKTIRSSTGNKRGAFAVVDVFLRINGHTITADSIAIYNYMLKLFEAHSFDMEY